MNASEPLPVDLDTLVVRAIEGDRRAAEDLILLYRQRIARFAIAQTGDTAHYEDLCQATFVKMVLALPKLRGTERFEPWLYQIARNVCRDHLRARRRWQRLFTPFDAQHETVSTPEEQSDRTDDVQQSIARLPETQRSLLRLSLDDRKSYEDMARLTDASVSAVKSRLHRARQNLRSLMLTENSE